MQLQKFPRGEKGPKYVVVPGLFGVRRESFGEPFRFGMAFGTTVYFSCFLKVSGSFSIHGQAFRIDSRWVHSPRAHVVVEAKSPMSKFNFSRS